MSQQPLDTTVKPKGFTIAEKWIIWGVFCLLIGLSTHILITPAMLLITLGIVRWRILQQAASPWFQRLLAMLLVAAGGGLMWWAVVLLRIG